MPYGCSIERLLDTLAVTSPVEIAILKRERARVEHGLLSIGIKIHGLTTPPGFRALFDSLGGVGNVLEYNVYKSSRSEFCLVLPPLGSAPATTLLLNCLARHTECKIYGNPQMQIQVCSPGRLDPRRSALLAIAFYLGSDTLRRYSLADFTTTVSYDDRYKRGRRLIIYDAGDYGVFERDFAWWARNPFLTINPQLPFEKPARTDILVGTSSSLDMENINLIATLLVHAQYNEYAGCWREIGLLFEKELVSILKNHLLDGLLAAPWVHESGEPDFDDDNEFFGALQELTAYAFEEVGRLTRPSRRLDRLLRTLRPSILEEVRTLLQTYRAIVCAQAEPGGHHAL